VGGADVTASPPRVSVIVPTRDRLDLLTLMLEAMTLQTFRDFEIVLIDDGSKEDVRGLAERFSGDLSIRYVRSDGRGAVAARCFGLSFARGDILAFTDSDCEPDANWLAEGVAAIDDGASLVQGVTQPAREPALFERTLSYGGGEGLFATCNVFYTRRAYDAAGGFDRGASDRWRFRPDELAQGLGFGEDSLLGWRVARTETFRVAEKAVVRHAVTQPSLKEQFSRAWQAGAFPALVHEIPELRTTLLRSKVFLQSRTRVPFYAAVIALLAGRGEVAALASGIWAGAVVRRVVRHWGESIPKRLVAMPIELAREATVAIALLVGSVRSRTPVL
jgi:glycosyltransferase involved in cell wall biosynthesis